MTDLEALVVAAYVFADDYPVPPRAVGQRLWRMRSWSLWQSRRRRSGSALTASFSA